MSVPLEAHSTPPPPPQRGNQLPLIVRGGIADWAGTSGQRSFRSSLLAFRMLQGSEFTEVCFQGASVNTAPFPHAGAEASNSVMGKPKTLNYTACKARACLCTNECRNRPPFVHTRSRMSQLVTQRVGEVHTILREFRENLRAANLLG